MKTGVLHSSYQKRDLFLYKVAWDLSESIKQVPYSALVYQLPDENRTSLFFYIFSATQSSAAQRKQRSLYICIPTCDIDKYSFHLVLQFCDTLSVSSEQRFYFIYISGASCTGTEFTIPSSQNPKLRARNYSLKKQSTPYSFVHTLSLEASRIIAGIGRTTRHGLPSQSWCCIEFYYKLLVRKTTGDFRCQRVRM